MIFTISRVCFLVITLFTGGLFTCATSVAGESESFDVAEFHKILDSIEKSAIPENVKRQLYKDMVTTIIESVRNAKISSEVKDKIIHDLQSTQRE